MIELETPLWECQGIKVIPVSGYTKRNGACAMASPAGYEAMRRIPGIEYVVGGYIQEYGSQVQAITDEVVAFPYKPNWEGPPDFDLIQLSLLQLLRLYGTQIELFLARPGIGRGGMAWEDLVFLFDDTPDNLFLVPHG